MSKVNWSLVAEDMEGIVHAMWDCENCDWKLDGYRQLDDGENQAYLHATLNFHTVHGEIVTMRKITGKEK